MVSGKWEVQAGCLQQTDPGPADPKKAIMVIGDSAEVSNDVVVTAKLRLDFIDDDIKSRAGLGVCMNPETGHGLNLVFHRGKLQFLHDYVAIGPGCDFPYKLGEWYWMKLYKKEGEINGKAWKDGDKEPANWLITWHDFDEELSGYPGLNGGTYVGSSVSFASFDVRLAETKSKPSSLATDKVEELENQTYSNGRLSLVISKARIDGQTAFWIQEVQIKMPNGWQTILEGVDGQEFSTSLGSANATYSRL